MPIGTQRHTKHNFSSFPGFSVLCDVLILLLGGSIGPQGLPMVSHEEPSGSLRGTLGPLGSSLGPLRRSLEIPGDPLGPLGGPLGPLEAPLGTHCDFPRHPGDHYISVLTAQAQSNRKGLLAHLGSSLEPLWVTLGPLRRAMGPLMGALGSFGIPLAPLGTPMGPPKGPLDHLRVPLVPPRGGPWVPLRHP